MYEPHPVLTYSWDPNTPAKLSRSRSQASRAKSFDLGPHPADPLSMVHPATNGEYHTHTSSEIEQTVPGQEIWVYCGSGGYVHSITIDMLTCIHIFADTCVCVCVFFFLR